MQHGASPKRIAPDRTDSFDSFGPVHVDTICRHGKFAAGESDFDVLRPGRQFHLRGIVEENPLFSEFHHEFPPTESNGRSFALNFRLLMP